MKESLALLPALLAGWVAFRKSPQAAFVNVYLPVLLLLPDYYYWNAPGLPDPSFIEAPTIPIFAAFLVMHRVPWKFTLTDVLVVGYAFSVGYSEYLAAGYKEAQNLLFDCVAQVLLPYILAKGLIEPHRLREAAAKRFALLLFLVSVVSVFEFRFARNPWRMFFDPFFPFQGRGWIVSLRWGFGRTAGPFGHSILAGVILVAGYRLNRWVQWSGLWPKRISRWLPWQPLSTGAIIAWGYVLGLAMTMARGPWLGAMVAAVIAWVGKTKNRWQTLFVIAAVGAVVGIPALAAFRSYVSVGRSGAQSDTQETAAYRFELLQNYLDIVYQKPLFGWGRNTWPKVSGQPSIDNHYLLLLLMHGFSATLLLLSLLVVVGGKLFWHGMNEPPSQPPGSSFAMTLLGILVATYFAIATVFMGLNVTPVLFVVFGWAEGYLAYGRQYRPGAAAPPSAPPPRFQFSRVLT